MTGTMDNPQILLNSEFQREAAEYAVKVNEEWAKKLYVNPAARVTCIKPEGTASLVLGSSSGIHAHHAKRYFRRIQCNKLDPVFKYFKSINPHMSEESIWSANKTDDVLTFPVEVSDTAMVKKDLTAIQHLDIIKSTQLNWVLPGTGKTNKKQVTHNVSCTVIVDKDEWDAVCKYLFDNKNYFAAVSLLAKTGDKDYKQPPLEAIVTPQDEELWNRLLESFKPVNYKHLKEEDDQTTLQQELVCAGGQCELPIFSNE